MMGGASVGTCADADAVSLSGCVLQHTAYEAPAAGLFGLAAASPVASRGPIDRNKKRAGCTSPARKTAATTGRCGLRSHLGARSVVSAAYSAHFVLPEYSPTAVRHHLNAQYRPPLVAERSAEFAKALALFGVTLKQLVLGVVELGVSVGDGLVIHGRPRLLNQVFNTSLMSGMNLRTVSIPGLSRSSERMAQSVVNETPERLASSCNCECSRGSRAARTSAADGMFDFMSTNPIEYGGSCLSNSEAFFKAPSGRVGYRIRMDEAEAKAALWENVSTLMTRHWGRENLTRLSREAAVSPATATRIKDQQTSIGLDVLARIAGVFRVDPWQLIAPKLGADLYALDEERRIVPVVATPKPGAEVVGLPERRGGVGRAVTGGIASLANGERPQRRSEDKKSGRG